jgi:glutamine synthetase
MQEGKLDPTTEIRIPGVMTESEKKRIEVRTCHEGADLYSALWNLLLIEVYV